MWLWIGDAFFSQWLTLLQIETILVVGLAFKLFGHW